MRRDDVAPVYNPGNFPNHYGASNTEYVEEALDPALGTIEVLRRVYDSAAPSWSDNALGRAAARLLYFTENHSSKGWKYFTEGHEGGGPLVNYLYNCNHPEDIVEDNFSGVTKGFAFTYWTHNSNGGGGNWGCTAGGSSISIENSVMTASDSNLRSVSYSHPASANYLIAFMSVRDYDRLSIIGAAYNGVAMTKLGQTNFNDIRTAVFVMVNPPAGTHTLEGFFSPGGSTNTDTRAIAAYSLSNVGSVNDISSTSGIFSQNTFQVTVDSAPGDLVLDHNRWRQFDIDVSAIGSEQTVQLTDTRQHSTFELGDGTSTTMSQTTTGSHGGNDAVYYVISLTPAP
jgi:hypothetical protein